MLFRSEAVNQGLGQYADLFVKQATAESNLNPYAVSNKGASGLFQHMPATAQDLGIDPFNIDQSISGGIRYLGQQLNKFGSPDVALAAYNAGPQTVLDFKYGTNKSGRNPNLIQNNTGIPPFIETQDYIKRVLG